MSSKLYQTKNCGWNNETVAKDPNLVWCPTIDCNTICNVSNSNFNSYGTFSNSPTKCNNCGKEFLPHNSKDEKMKKKILRKNWNIDKCPNCKVLIQKNGGCDDMKCKNCETHFEFLVSKRKIRKIRDGILLTTLFILILGGYFALFFGLCWSYFLF